MSTQHLNHMDNGTHVVIIALVFSGTLRHYVFRNFDREACEEFAAMMDNLKDHESVRLFL